MCALDPPTLLRREYCERDLEVNRNPTERYRIEPAACNGFHFAELLRAHPLRYSQVVEKDREPIAQKSARRRTVPSSHTATAPRQ